MHLKKVGALLVFLVLIGIVRFAPPFKANRRSSLELRLKSHPMYQSSSQAWLAWRRGKQNNKTVFSVSNGGNIGNQEHIVTLVTIIAMALNLRAAVNFDSTSGGVFNEVIEERSIYDFETLNFESLLCRNLSFVALEKNLYVDFSQTFFPPYWLFMNVNHKNYLKKVFRNHPFGLMSHHLFALSKDLRDEIEEFERGRLSSCDFVIGIHIRYGRGPSDFYFSEANPLVVGKRVGAFTEAIFRRKNSVSPCIFLATDNDKIRKKFASFVAPAIRIVTQDFVAGPDASSYRNSAFDQELLARSDLMIGTFVSSFSMYSMARGLFREAYWINHLGHCFLSPPDGGIPWIRNRSKLKFLSDLIRQQEKSNTCGTDLSPMKRWLIESDRG